jgi:molybdate transport system substrate-binding protein
MALTTDRSDTIYLLCAGAVQGLIKQLASRFEDQTGAVIRPRFGAVGAMKELLLAGEPCDVMIVTDAMIVSLQAAGDLAPQARSPLGRVRTGIAVPSGRPTPDVASPEKLKAVLLAASAIYFPDPHRATAGIHFASVIDRLCIRDAVSAKVRNFPNGATSMRELASDHSAAAIGCTQITEINYTPGIDLVGPLPHEFELATVYSAAVAARTSQPALAQRLIDLLAGSHTRSLRLEGGFELGFELD